jgi:hypothetical protein
VEEKGPGFRENGVPVGWKCDIFRDFVAES